MFKDIAQPVSEARASETKAIDSSSQSSASVQGSETQWLATDVSNPSEVIALDEHRFAVSMGCYHGGGCATRLPGSVEWLEVSEGGEARWTGKVQTGGYPARLAYDAERDRLFVCDGDENGRLFVIPTGRDENVTTRPLGAKGACSDVKVRGGQLFATDSARREISFWEVEADQPTCTWPAPSLRGGRSIPIAMAARDNDLLLLVSSPDYASSALFSYPLGKNGHPLVCSEASERAGKQLALLGPAANQVEEVKGAIFTLVSGGSERSTPILQKMPGDGISFPPQSNPYHFATDANSIYVTLFAANRVVYQPLDAGKEGGWTDVPGLDLARATSPSGIALAGHWLVTTFVQMHEVEKKIRFGGLVGVTRIQP